MSDDKKTDDLKPSLLGSSSLPSAIDVGAAEPIQLGLVVANAFAASGKTEDDWNTMPDADREALLEAEIGRLREENAKPVEDKTEPDMLAALREDFSAQLAALREELAGEIEKARGYVDEQLEKIHAAFEGLDLEKLESLAAQLKDGGLEARLKQVEDRLRGFIH